MKHRIMLTAATICLWAVPASAQMVRAQDPEGVVRAMQGFGYPAKLGADTGGDPMITSSVSGTNFSVFFYNCTEHKACATVQLQAAYKAKQPVTLEQINQWNRDQRFGRALLDKQNDPVLQMDIDLDDGGLSTALFTDNLEFWASVLENFEKRIGYR